MFNPYIFVITFWPERVVFEMIKRNGVWNTILVLFLSTSQGQEILFNVRAEMIDNQ